MLFGEDFQGDMQAGAVGFAGRSIGDFTRDGAAAGACGKGKIGWAAMPSRVGKKSESVGFLGGFGDTEPGRRKDFDGRERGRELRADEIVPRSLHCATAKGAVAPVGMTVGATAQKSRHSGRDDTREKEKGTRAFPLMI